jgi:hypothetical protein
MIVVRVSRRSALAGVLGCVVFGLVCVVGVAPAFASSAWWHLTAQSRPTVLKAGADGQVVFVAANLGNGSVNAEGIPVSVQA